MMMQASSRHGHCVLSVWPGDQSVICKSARLLRVVLCGRLERAITTFHVLWNPTYLLPQPNYRIMKKTRSAGMGHRSQEEDHAVLFGSVWTC